MPPDAILASSEHNAEFDVRFQAFDLCRNSEQKVPRLQYRNQPLLQTNDIVHADSDNVQPFFDVDPSPVGGYLPVGDLHRSTPEKFRRNNNESTPYADSAGNDDDNIVELVVASSSPVGSPSALELHRLSQKFRRNSCESSSLHEDSGNVINDPAVVCRRQLTSAKLQRNRLKSVPFAVAGHPSVDKVNASVSSSSSSTFITMANVSTSSSSTITDSCSSSSINKITTMSPSASSAKTTICNKCSHSSMSPTSAVDHHQQHKMDHNHCSKTSSWRNPQRTDIAVRAEATEMRLRRCRYNAHHHHHYDLEEQLLLLLLPEFAECCCVSYYSSSESDNGSHGEDQHNQQRHRTMIDVNNNVAGIAIHHRHADVHKGSSPQSQQQQNQHRSITRRCHSCSVDWIGESAAAVRPSLRHGDGGAERRNREIVTVYKNDGDQRSSRATTFTAECNVGDAYGDEMRLEQSSRAATFTAEYINGSASAVAAYVRQRNRSRHSGGGRRNQKTVNAWIKDSSKLIRHGDGLQKQETVDAWIFDRNQLVSHSDGDGVKLKTLDAVDDGVKRSKTVDAWIKDGSKQRSHGDGGGEVPQNRSRGNYAGTIADCRKQDAAEPSTDDKGAQLQSYAVAKSSDNPKQDFKESMVEMIVEKQVQGSYDLMQLLQCYLTLNSDIYHGTIIRAFAEVWTEFIVHQHRSYSRS